MNREIKFRAWDGERMVSPDYIERNGQAIWKENSIKTWSNMVMQYTGLKDKNGKEIYEGDIVLDNNKKSKIVWFDEGAQFVSQTIDDSDWDIMTAPECGGDYEVIGNIYETPELLK